MCTWINTGLSGQLMKKGFYRIVNGYMKRPFYRDIVTGLFGLFRSFSMISKNVFSMIILTPRHWLCLAVWAAVDIGAAAVTASSTEKGFSTSVSDGVIEAKLLDKFIQTD